MKNSKRIISFVLLIALSVCIFVACSKASADDNGKAADKKFVDIAEGYLDCIVGFDYSGAAEFMGKRYEDKEIDYADELTSALVEVLTKDVGASEKTAIESKKNDLKVLVSTHLLDKISYKIDEESLEVNGDTAKLKYTLTVPDMKVIKEEMDQKLKETDIVKEAPQPEGIRKIDCLESILTKSRGEDAPSLTKKQDFVITIEKKGDTWIVVSDEQSK